MQTLTQKLFPTPVELSTVYECRMPIIDKYKDMGTVVMGKIESGTIREGDSLLVMPNKVRSIPVDPFSLWFTIILLGYVRQAKLAL